MAALKAVFFFVFFLTFKRRFLTKHNSTENAVSFFFFFSLLGPMVTLLRDPFKLPYNILSPRPKNCKTSVVLKTLRIAHLFSCSCFFILTNRNVFAFVWMSEFFFFFSFSFSFFADTVRENAPVTLKTSTNLNVWSDFYRVSCSYSPFEISRMIF